MWPLPIKSSHALALSLAAAAAIAGAGYLSWRSLTSATPAPDVPYTLLDGSRAQLGALRGQVVLVNFWATTCASCIREMPQLIATHDKFSARGFQTLAVAMSYDAPALVATFAESRRLPFGVVIDNTGHIAQAFGDVRLTPTTFVVDKRGRIVKRYVGEPDFVALHALVEKLLAEPA